MNFIKYWSGVEGCCRHQTVRQTWQEFW